MFNKEKIIYYLQGGLMILIFISPLVFNQYRMPFSHFDGYEIIALVLGFLGITLSLLTMKAMGSSFETRPRPKKEGSLVTSFPFNYSRNPMYISGFFLTLSWSFGHKSMITFILSLALLLVLVFKVRLEEAFLEERFCEDYLRYKEKTPRWLLF